MSFFLITLKITDWLSVEVQEVLLSLGSDVAFFMYIMNESYRKRDSTLLDFRPDSCNDLSINQSIPKKSTPKKWRGRRKHHTVCPWTSIRYLINTGTFFTLKWNCTRLIVLISSVPSINRRTSQTLISFFWLQQRTCQSLKCSPTWCKRLVWRHHRRQVLLL